MLRTNLVFSFALLIPNVVLAQENVEKQKNGIAVEAQLQTGGETSVLAAGYRKNGWMGGLYVDLNLQYAENGLPDTPSYGTAISWSVGATGRAPILESGDGKVELFLQADFGLGESTLASAKNKAIRVSRITYFTGVGMQFWLHPQFALGGRLGFRGLVHGGDLNTHELKSVSGLHVLGVF